MASIYELNKDYAELSAMLEAAETEEEIQAIQDTLEMINVSIEEKLENTAMYMVNVESDIQGIKTEIDRLTKIKKAKENAVERLKNNVEYAMKQKGIDAITNLDVIPADFTKVEIKADKTAIKKAIKSGEVVEGAEIKVNQNFYIK